MKKVLMALLAVLALASCKKEAPEHPQEKAPTKDEFVELNIGGELSQEAKALTLIPGRNDQNKAILSPKFMGQNTVRAHYFVYDNSGNFIHGVIDLGIQNGGKTFRYDGRNINVGGISTPRYLSVYLGFDDAGKFTNSEYAAIYREDQPVSINVAFKSEHNLLDERPNSIRNLNLKFDLIGSLVRTKIYNKTQNNFSATGIVASGFGNKGLSIRTPQPSATPPTNYKRPWLTADSNDAHEFKFRSSTIVEGLKNSADTYLIYCPGVNNLSPTENASGSLSISGTTSGRRGWSRDATLYGMLMFGGTGRKVLSQSSRLLQTTVNIENGLLPPLGYLSAYAVGYQLTMMTENLANSFFTYGSPDGQGIKKVTILGDFRLGAGVHLYRKYGETGMRVGFTPTEETRGLRDVPTEMEFNAFLPQVSPEEAYASLGSEFTQQSQPYMASFREEGSQIDGLYYCAQDDYYREAVYSFSPGRQVSLNLLYGGDLAQKPLYALRYKPVTSPIPTEVLQALSKRGSKIQSNLMRVAYRYTYKKSHLLIESCVVNDDARVSSAKDVKTLGLFDGNSHWAVVKRVIPFFGNLPYYDSGDLRAYYLGYKQTVSSPLTDPAVPSTHADLLRVRDGYPSTRLVSRKDFSNTRIETSTLVWGNSLGQIVNYGTVNPTIRKGYSYQASGSIRLLMQTKFRRPWILY